MTPLRDRFGRHLARWTGVDGFLAWWGRSLAAWIPARWRRAVGMDRGRLLLQAQGDEVRVQLQRAEGLRELARMPRAGAGELELRAALASELADLPRWLLLPAAAGLRRRLALPVAARERLREVVGFEIDRQTPFSADAVAFDARVLGRLGSEGQLDVELVVVPRSTLAAQLEQLGLLGAGLAGADLAGADARPLGINLLPPAQRRQQRDPARGWNLVLGAVALLALVAMLGQLLDNRERALAELQARADREARAAREVSLQRQQLSDLVEGRAFIEGLRQSRPTAIEVLDATAQRLPDDTWLEKLAIDNDQLLLIGLSSEASSLVGRLTGGPWRSPALTGVLQPDPASGRDRFTLTAELGAAAPTPATGGADAQRR